MLQKLIMSLNGIFARLSCIIKTIVYFNDLVSCTSLGGINIRVLGFVIQVSIYIYILRPDQERLRKS